MPDGGKGGIRMAWLPIVVGIVIGYMLYRNKQQNTGTEEDRREYGGRETRRDAERADREAHSSRSIQRDPHNIAKTAVLSPYLASVKTPIGWSTLCIWAMRSSSLLV